MNKKNLVYTVVILLTALAIGAGVYFKKDSQPENNILAKDDFSISVPQGWQETQAPTGVSAIVVNASEEITDPAAQEVNFRSYLSVSRDSLKGKSKEEYIEDVKSSLGQLSPTVNFTEDKQIMVGEKEAEAMEVEITQQEVNFKVLLVLVWGEGEDVWVMGFNTTEDKWNEYSSLFYQIAATFQIKK